MTVSIDSSTPLSATFQFRINGDLVVLKTVGDAARFIENDRTVEWLEHYGARRLAIERLQSAAENAIHIRNATNALRTLLARAKLI